MKTTQVLTDKLAIGLSLACAIHCLLLPILLVLLPSMAALQLDNEAFHLWMVIAVIPSSAYALSLGCKQHKRYQLLILGCTGVTLLVLALMLGEEQIGESGEKIMTVIGSACIVIGHWLNYRLCQTPSHKDCGCTTDEYSDAS